MTGRSCYLWHVIDITFLISCTFGSYILEYNVRKNNAGGQYTKPFADCPFKRPAPEVKILDRIIYFPNVNCSRKASAINKTVKDGKNSRDDLAISILLRYKCPQNESRTMGAFQWQSVAMEIECRPETFHKMSIRKSNMTYRYNLSDGEGDIHAIIRIESSEKPDAWPLTVRINGGSNNSSDKASVKVPPQTQVPWMTFGHKPQKETSTYKPGPFLGSVLAADIIHGPFDNHVLDTEVRYMTQVLLGLPYPECLWPESSTTDDPETRHRHSCPQRHYHLTETDTQNILLEFKQPAMVTKLEVTAEKEGMDIYSGNNPLTGIKLFPGYEEQKNINMNGKVFHEYTWESGPGIYPIITRNISIDIADNQIHCIIARGRYLKDEGDHDQCFCFPGNSQENEKCNSCGQCKCRKNTDTHHAGKSCKPYLSKITPHFGPASGNITLTIHGGLLNPQNSMSHKDTAVNVNGNSFCHDINRKDDSITCHVRPRHNTSTLVSLEVKIEVGGAMYKIDSSLNYTYRPDPRVSNITPSKGFPIGKQIITITASHLDSFPIGDYTDAVLIFLKSENKTFKGNCTIKNAENMICQMPRFRVNTTVSASLSFVINGFQLESTIGSRSSTIMMYQMPSFIYSEHMDYDGNLLDLKGKYLNSCCEKADYRIYVGGSGCQIVDLSNDTLRCRLGPVDTSDSRKPITVGVLGHIIQAGFLENRKHEFQSGYKHHTTTSIISVIAALVFVGMIFVSILYLKKRGISSEQLIPCRRKKSRTETIPLQYTLDKDSYYLLNYFGPSMKAAIENMLIKMEDIDIFERIGRGHSGAVYRGRLVQKTNFKAIALKTLKDGKSADKADLKEFMEEATIMKGFDHPNVVSLIGVAMNKRDLYVVLPYMQNGDLRSYVSKQRFDTMKFARFALDVSRGMEYLSDHKFVHRDLAARNCMVDDRETVYIGDFGLARDIHQKDYYRPEYKQRPLPFKWMALESLEDQTFTSKSDIWALGVVLWEIFSKGARPYPHVENFYLYDYLRDGYRLTKPRDCPESIFVWMRLCWQEDPDDRPSCRTIVREISKFTTPTEDNVPRTIPDEDSNAYLKPVNHPSTSKTGVDPLPIAVDTTRSRNTGDHEETQMIEQESDHEYETYDNSGQEETVVHTAGDGDYNGQDITVPTVLNKSRPSSLKKPRTLRKGDVQLLAEGHPCLTMAAMGQLRKKSRKANRSRSFHSQPIQERRPCLRHSESDSRDIPGAQIQGEEEFQTSGNNAWRHGPMIVRTPSKRNEYVSYSTEKAFKHRPSTRIWPQTQDALFNSKIGTRDMKPPGDRVNLRKKGVNEPEERRLSLSISQEICETL